MANLAIGVTTLQNGVLDRRAAEHRASDARGDRAINSALHRRVERLPHINSMHCVAVLEVGVDLLGNIRHRGKRRTAAKPLATNSAVPENPSDAAPATAAAWRSPGRRDNGDGCGGGLLGVFSQQIAWHWVASHKRRGSLAAGQGPKLRSSTTYLFLVFGALQLGFSVNSTAWPLG